MTSTPLTTLLDEYDKGHAEVEPCHQLGCNIYINKPMEHERFCEALHELGIFLQFAVVPDAAD